ncbi:MAG: DUF547 domain-containing protein [Planctomycetota bacterium]
MTPELPSRRFEPPDMNASRPIALALFPLFSLLPGQSPAKPSPPAKSPELPRRHEALDRILRAHVQGGLVDYEGLRREDLSNLEGYLDAMAAVDPKGLRESERLAYYVNVYNATMLRAVLDETAKDPAWTPAASDFAVFRQKRVRLSGARISLDDLENGILRKEFREPRVHVAIVCAAKSCPVLLPRAYEAEDLDETLRANLRSFLRDPSRNRVDEQGGVLRLSKIFEWFQEDFGGEKGILALVKEHLGPAAAGYRIEYLDYSWDLNRAPSPRRKNDKAAAGGEVAP